jgi:hypothetical protein
MGGDYIQYTWDHRNRLVQAWHLANGSLLGIVTIGGHDSTHSACVPKCVRLPNVRFARQVCTKAEASIPTASTLIRNKPFGENVEGLSYCGILRHIRLPKAMDFGSTDYPRSQ